MKYYTYPLTDSTNKEKLTVRDLLVAGVEFICAMACVPAIIAVAGLAVTMVK